MASFFMKFNHWSKDIIFLFSDHTTIGTQAFLQSYHGEKSRVLSYATLNHHGGEIREGLTLDMPGDGDYSHLGMYAQGVNGQQANGDIVTVVTRLCQWVGAGFALQEGEPGIVSPDNLWKYYLKAAGGLIDYAKYQAVGGAISDHALFPRWRIEGVTIIGRGSGTVGLHHVS
jgi:hypothetical protein